MVVIFPWHHIMKKAKLCIKIIVLAIILFYILPKLLSQIWFFNHDPKIHYENFDKPLRVTNISVKIT